MLRGLTGSGVPVIGTRFIDIIKQRLPSILNNASGDMLARLRSPARIKHWRAFAGECHQKKVLLWTLPNGSGGTARKLPSCTFVMNWLRIGTLRGHMTAAPLKRQIRFPASSHGWDPVTSWLSFGLLASTSAT